MQHGKTTSAKELITSDLDSACEISKKDLKSYVTKRLRIIHPEWISLLTQRILNQTLIYLEGYSARLKEEMYPPVIISDVQTYLLSEGFRYICKRLEQQ